MTNLTYIGLDDWSRRLFKTENDAILVDVEGELYTTTPDWGEPCSPTGIKTPELESDK